MEFIWTLIYFMTFIKCNHFLSHPFSSKTTISHADKLEEPKMSVSELMKYCPHKCACYNLTVNCEYTKLTHIPKNLHYSVNHLNVASNEIIDLFYNSSLENLRVLNVSQNNLQNIDRNWIPSLMQLEVLDLSQNSLQSKTIENIFKSPALHYLNLSHNKLSELNDRMFQDLNSLFNLDISFNEIESISRGCFWKQKHLQMLNLSSNKLSDLQYDWFQNLKSLNTLILRQNRLKILRNVVFFPLKHLQVLDISQNYIKSVGLLSFKGLVNLSYLNISSNNVSHFQDGVFRFLTLLKVLDISQNPFISIDNIFIHTPRIQFLHMNGLSKFSTLNPSSLVGLKRLEYLDLSGSKNLSKINIKAFSPVKLLKTLDLSYAKLSELKKGVFSHFSELESIKLGGNPWKCDCYMYWLLIWLSEHSSTHILSPSETLCSTPLSLEGHVLLDALDHNMVCTNASVSYITEKTKFKVGSPAFLQCQVEGDPLPSLTWVTPQKLSFQWVGLRNYSDEKDIGFVTTYRPHIIPDDSTEENNGRFFLMPNGNLAIRNVERGDGGFYVCIASNPLNSDSMSVRLTLDYEYFVQIKIVSVLVGVATSFGFLLLTLIAILIKMILKHFGVKCPCRSGSASPRTQQIKKILESMEHYKKQQLDRLRDNYNGQVQRIRVNCMQQMERLRESYSSQAERLRDIKEYGTLQIDRIRENYYFQVSRVRDYSASQIIRLRENYIFQRNRIRKFSAHHLYKLRENYKLQQQHLNKILENLNIESCRNVCQRTDSVMFEPEITLENVLVPVPKICLQTFIKETCDSIDNSSQISAYFTPDETGSEVSGHEIDERDIFENTSKLKMLDKIGDSFENTSKLKMIDESDDSFRDTTKLKLLDKTDVIVRMEEDSEHTTSHIPDQVPCSSSQMPAISNQKPSNETIV